MVSRNDGLKLIHEEWESYAQAIFKGMTPTEAQYQETRKAFFAGAYVLYSQCLLIGEPVISEERGCEHMTDLGDEFERFFEQIRLW